MSQEIKKIKLDESHETTKGIIEQWKREAKDMTFDRLPEFIGKLMNDYSHDYGTIIHAMSIGAIATMWAMDKMPGGGITGFQAGMINFQNIYNWDTSKEGHPLKLVDYDNMLYPQYEYHFDKTISQDTFNYLQKEAQKKIDKSPGAHEDVYAHWLSIIDGKVPFGYTIKDK